MLAGAATGLVSARSGEDLAQTPQIDEAMNYLAGLDESHPAEWHAGRALARATAVAQTGALIESATTRDAEHPGGVSDSRVP